MKLPFSKKNPDQPEGPDSGSKKKRFRIQVKMKDRSKQTTPTDPEGTEVPETEFPESPPVEETKPQKPKKQKKPKKEKPQKVKKPKTKGEKKKLPLVLIIVGAVVIVAGIVVAVLLLTGGKSVEDRLEQAAEHLSAGEYEPAAEIYSELLQEDLTLVDAHLGLAEVYVAQDNFPDAVLVLEQGLLSTDEDERIAARLKELTPDPEDEDAPEQSAPPPPSSAPIVWTDPAFESMVRMALEVSASEPISPADLDSVKTLKIVGGTHAAVNEDISAFNSAEGYTIDDELHTDRGDIRSLDDLAHFKSLQKISISYNYIDDIGGIAGLARLNTVALPFNDIGDLSALSSLSELRYLYLYYNNITSIEPLSGLSGLRQLLLQNNQISDLGPLRGLTELNELWVSGNQITSLEPLSGLGSLRFLFADNNSISDLSPLAGLESLTDVSFLGNPASDYSPVGHVRNVNKPR